MSDAVRLDAQRPEPKSDPATDADPQWLEWARARQLEPHAQKAAAAATALLRHGATVHAAVAAGLIAAGRGGPDDLRQLGGERTWIQSVVEDLKKVGAPADLVGKYEARLTAVSSAISAFDRMPVAYTAPATVQQGANPWAARADLSSQLAQQGVVDSAGGEGATRPPAPPFSLHDMFAEHSVLILAALGAFLLVVATVLFELYGTVGLGGGTRLAAVVVLNLVFGVAGYLARRRAGLEAVGQIYIALAAVLLPLVGVAAWTFLDLGGHGLTVYQAVAITSGACAVAYGGLASRLGLRAYGEMTGIAILVAIVSVSRWAGGDYWLGAGVALGPLVYTPWTRLRPGGRALSSPSCAPAPRRHPRAGAGGLGVLAGRGTVACRGAVDRVRPLCRRLLPVAHRAHRLHAARRPGLRAGRDGARARPGLVECRPHRRCVGRLCRALYPRRPRAPAPVRIALLLWRAPIRARQPVRRDDRQRALGDSRGARDCSRRIRRRRRAWRGAVQRDHGPRPFLRRVVCRCRRAQRRRVAWPIRRSSGPVLRRDLAGPRGGAPRHCHRGAAMVRPCSRRGVADPVFHRLGGSGLVEIGRGARRACGRLLVARAHTKRARAAVACLGFTRRGRRKRGDGDRAGELAGCDGRRRTTGPHRHLVCAPQDPESSRRAGQRPCGPRHHGCRGRHPRLPRRAADVGPVGSGSADRWIPRRVVGGGR